MMDLFRRRIYLVAVFAILYIESRKFDGYGLNAFEVAPLEKGMAFPSAANGLVLSDGDRQLGTF